MALSMAMARSSIVHGFSRSWKTNWCSIVCVPLQSNVPGSLELPHFRLLTFDLPIVVWRLFKHLQVNQPFSVPAGKHLAMSVCILTFLASISSHISSRVSVGDYFSDSIAARKLGKGGDVHLITFSLVIRAFTWNMGNSSLIPPPFVRWGEGRGS